MASIYANGQRIYLSYVDAFGKRVQKSLGLPTTREGWAEAKDLLQRIEAELKVSPVNFTLKQERLASTKLTLDEFAKVLAAEPEYRSGHSKNSLHLNELSVKKFTEAIGPIPLSRVKVDTMWRFREWAIAKDGEVNTSIYLRHIGGIFSAAVERELIPTSPVTKKVRIRLQKQNPIAMTRAEVEAFLSKAKEMYGDAFERQCRFLALTGFRADESCQITRSHIEFDRRYIKHVNAKGKRTEPFPLYPKLEALLDSTRPLPAEARVFHYGSPATISHYFTAVRKELGFDTRYSLHTLKKNFVSALTEAKVNPLYLQRLANHADLKTTEWHYIWWNMDELRNEVERASQLLP